MTEEIAREILGGAIRDDDSLNSIRFLQWQAGWDAATLDDSFTADELEAIAWWMRNKRRVTPERHA